MTSRPVAGACSPSSLDSTCGSCGVSAGFWFLGVNFRPQALQSLILRLPMVLVFLTPLLTDLPDVPQYGHLAGLPLVMWITSRDMEEACIYKPLLSQWGDNLGVSWLFSCCLPGSMWV